MKRISILFLLLVLHSAAAEPEPVRSDSSRVQRIEEMFSEYQLHFKDAPIVSAQELIARGRDVKVLIIDVRTEKERKVSVIPNSISREEFERDESRHMGKKIIVYCTIGYRSGLYTARMRKKGLDAYNLKGGVLAWASAGQPFVDREGPTKRVHVYGVKWNLLPPGYEAVW